MRSKTIVWGIVLLALSTSRPAASEQVRQAATPKPQSAPPLALQPIPGGPPDPERVEIGTLKQQVTLLQQAVQQLQTENGVLKQKIARLETLGERVVKLESHRHDTGLGFATWKTVQSGACPECMVAFTQPGKTPQYTSPPKY
jgi:hypothetical protein